MRASRRLAIQALALFAMGAVPAMHAEGPSRIVGWLHYGRPKVDGYGQSGPESLPRQFMEVARRKNVTFVRRFCGEDPARVAPLARELVALNPAAICSMDNDMCTHGLFAATRRIPLVVVIIDPVGDGMAESLSRPGRNVTGFAEDRAEDKQLSLLREVLPRLSRLAVLVPAGPGRPGTPLVPEDPPIRSKAEALGIAAQRHAIASVEEAERLFASLPPDGTAAAYLYWHRLDRKALAAAALRHRVPTMASINYFVEQGALMSYQTFHKDWERRFARMLERVLDGVDPGTIPFDLPNHSSFYVNRATAKALGITIPERVLMTADKVVG